VKGLYLGFFFYCYFNILGKLPYPQDFLPSPSRYSIILSGTICELRFQPFSSGFDIKTQQRQGITRLCNGDGTNYADQVSEWVMAKHYIIAHPNGLHFRLWAIFKSSHPI